MASFLTDRMRSTILDGGFNWASYPFVKMLLVGAEEAGDYDPVPNVPYTGGIVTLQDLEPAVANYARQDVTGTNSTTSFVTHTSTALVDDVVFPALGAPGDVILGAWVFVDPADDDATAYAFAWLDFRDEDGNGVGLTGGDFVVHFPASSLFTIREG